MKVNFYRINQICGVHIVATFGDARLVRHIGGRYELRGGSVSDHTDAKEWISLFLHEAVVSLPSPVAGQTRLSGIARSGAHAAVRWVRGLCASPRLRPCSPH